MQSLGMGLIVAGGFLFGMGIGHIILFASTFATVGVIMITLGLVALFWRPACRGRTQKGSGGRT